MAESILVTGLKISNMELVTSVTGSEKLPTGQDGDLAITPNQIADHTIERGDLVSQEDLSQVEVNLTTQIENTNLEVANQTAQIRNLLSNETTARINGDASLADSITSLDEDKVDKSELGTSAYTDSTDYATPSDLVDVENRLNTKVGYPLYKDVASALGTTVNGDFFTVLSVTEGTFSELYKNVDGVAVSQGVAVPNTSHTWGVDSVAYHNQNMLSVLDGLESVAEMLLIENPTQGMRVHVKSYHAPTYTGFPIFEGGGDFMYVSALSSVNDGGMCLNGWVRLKQTYNYLTPEMFGAKGIGSAFDDYPAIQNMLDAGAKGCTFEFDGAKTYYNNFGGFTSTSPWLDEEDRPQWKRSLSCTFKFNGAKLTRRRPDWNTNNTNSDGNTGSFYTDDKTGLLILTGDGSADDIWYMYGANFDSNVPLGWLYNYNTNSYDIGDGAYGAGTCMDWGLRLENIGVFKAESCLFQKSCFPVSAVNCKYIYMNGLTLKYASQARYRTNSIDPGAYGGGIKLENCTNIYLDNVYGYKNANDTVELERYNKHAFVRGRSEKDINQSLMIYSSSDTSLDWEATDILLGTGVTIKASGAGTDSSGVRGNIHLKRVYGTGLNIIIDEDYDSDLTGINLKLYTEDCGYGGLQILNSSTTNIPKGVEIDHTDTNGNTWLNASRRFSGGMTGRISGRNQLIDGATYPSGFRGFVVEGTNTADTCLTMNLDLTGIPLVWEVSETAFVALQDTVTSWGVFNLTANRQNISGGASAGLHYPANSSSVASSEFSIDSTKIKASNLGSTATEDGQIYVDLSTGASVSGGTVYQLKYFAT